jgi:hypothetical protein
MPFMGRYHFSGAFSCPSKDVLGMVFVDTNTDSIGAGKWPLPYFEAVKANVYYMTTTVLAVDCVLYREEVGIVMKRLAEPREPDTRAAEQKGYPGDPPVLAVKKHFEKEILGNRPISVIRADALRDFQRLYDAGVTLGNGTEEEREKSREFLVSFAVDDQKNQEEILTLSTISCYVRATSGHNVQVTSLLRYDGF